MNNKELKKIQKHNKLNRYQTYYENIFRQSLYKANIHYQKQKIMGYCIVDFYLPKRGLIIEIDGDSHNFTHEKDYRRDQFFQSFSFTTLRFRNEDIRDRLFWCVSKVLDYPETNKRYRQSKSCRKALQSYSRINRLSSELIRLVIS